MLPEAALRDGLPILLPYQQRWAREVAPVAVMEKSRRIGLSWADAGERSIYAGTAGAAGGSVMYMSYAHDMTETYIRDCHAWSRWYQHAVSDVLSETVVSDDGQYQRHRLRYDSGHQIVALTSRPRALRSRGQPGDVVVIDEAAFCDDLAELLKAAVAVTQWGGRVRIVSTHNGADSPFAELVEDVRAGRRPYALHRVTLDDAIADGLARRVCSVRGERWHDGYAAEWRAAAVAQYALREDADEELFCVPRHGAGAWLPRVLIEARMVDAPIVRLAGDDAYNALPEPARRAEMAGWLAEQVEPLLARLDRDRRHVAGLDFGRRRHLSVIAPLELGATLRRTCPWMIEMRAIPHQQQVQAIAYVCDRLPRLAGVALDATGPGAYVAEATVDRYGTLAEAVTLSESWYREHMPPLKAAFEDDRIALPRDDDVLSDLRAVRLVRGVPRLPDGQTASARGARHGDSAIALALAWYAGDGDRGPYAYTPVRPGRALDDDEDPDGWPRDDAPEPGWGAGAPRHGGLRGVM